MDVVKGMRGTIAELRHLFFFFFFFPRAFLCDDLTWHDVNELKNVVEQTH